MTKGTRKLSNIDIGRRLRTARESAALTQADVARKINMARTTLVSIEKGQRRVRIDELQKLAALYKTSANAILRHETVYPDLVPRFRRLRQSTNAAVEKAIQILNGLVSAEIELEAALGIEHARRYLPERQILPGDNIKEQAEQNAQELRNWLGLGPGPILDIVSMLDQRLGIRVYIRKIDSKISGLFAYEEDVGACVLLNANHPVDRIRQSAAHELGHFYSARQRVGIYTEDIPNSREERYADHFARCFLTPAREVKERFVNITAGQSHFTRRHVILLAHQSGVSREAMVRRLEDLSLVKRGTWDWFLSNGGITDEQAREVLGNLPERHVSILLSGGLLPPRLSLLAREVSKRNLYSESQLAQLLRLNRYELREVLDGVENEQEEANELSRLPN